MKAVYKYVASVIILMGISVGFSHYLNKGEGQLNYYISHIFLPIQKAKSNFLNHIPFSVGDIIYLLLFLFLLFLIIRLIYFLITLKRNRKSLLIQGLQIIVYCLAVYLSFLISWGGNYYRPELSNQWGKEVVNDWDTKSLIELNWFLVGKLNDLSQQEIHFPAFKEVDKEANKYYHETFTPNLPQLKVKKTSISYLLNYAGIRGYYNPLTGEGQFNADIPPFMHPFVVAHEMAHQAGIAQEDDANLLAYIVSIRSKNPAFEYSAYFNIFLYAYSALKASDSSEAKLVWQSLNKKSLEDIYTLRRIHRSYKSIFRGLSYAIYNQYLIWNGQQKGLKSYDVVIKWVYYWEFKSKEKSDLNICPSN